MALADYALSVPGYVTPGLGQVSPIAGAASAAPFVANVGAQSYAIYKDDKPTTGQAGVTLATGIATGAAAGAATGSVVPVIGTAIGAAIGAVVGAIPGAIAMAKALEGGSSHAERMAKFGRALQQSEGQADLQGAAKVVQGAVVQLQAFQGLAERAQSKPVLGPEATEALTRAAEANRVLAEETNTLVEDVNTYVSRRDKINPWQVQEPATLALQRIPKDVSEASVALSNAAATNLELSNALAREGA